MRVSCSRAMLLTSVFVGLWAVSPAAAQAFKPDQADRAAAVKEGVVSWYTSTPFPLVQFLADRFTKDTGVKVALLRTGGEAVLRRFMQEYKAGQAGADVVTFSDAAAANSLTKQGVFVAFKPEGFDKVIEGAKDPGGHWIAQRVALFGMPYRTDKLAEKDRPKTWSDLTNPKYKGLMVMPDPNFTAIQVNIVGTLSRKLGWDFYKGLRKNDCMIVQGHQGVFKTIQRGERILGAEGSDPRTFNKGKEVPNMSMLHPVDGVFIVSSPVGIVKNASHPNAAKLLAQWMLSPVAQKIIAESAIYSPRSDMPPPKGQPPLKSVKFVPVDLAYIEANAKMIKTKFSEIFQ
jgi:iron(III) transport system substrate-binding protein